jgi:hypothetical protein
MKVSGHGWWRTSGGAVVAGLAGLGLLIMVGGGTWWLIPSGNQKVMGVGPSGAPSANPTNSHTTAPSPSPTETLEHRVVRDFLADQAKYAEALEQGNSLSVGNRLIEQAAYDMIVILSKNQTKHLVETDRWIGTEVTVATGSDPKFPPDAIVVEEKGYKSVTLKGSSDGAVVKVDHLKIDDRYLMRFSGGRYAIADSDLNELPGESPATNPVSSPSPGASPSPSPSVSPSPTPSRGAVPPGAVPTSERATLRKSPVPFALSEIFGLALIVAAFAVARRRRRSLPGDGAVAVATASAEGAVVDGDGPYTSGLARAWVQGFGSDDSVKIQTLGRLRVWGITGEEVSSLILEHPILSFLFFYLMVVGLEGSQAVVQRGDLADELYVGAMDPSSKRDRLRRRLSDLKSDFPKGVGDFVRADGENCWFDLEGCVIDAAELIRLGAECATMQVSGDESADLVGSLEAALRASSSGFLGFWADLEERVTSSRGGAGQHVENVRIRIENARLAIASYLGRVHLVASRPDRAVLVLQDCVDQHPEREDLARSLHEAYIRLGRRVEAEALANTYGFTGGMG